MGTAFPTLGAEAGFSLATFGAGAGAFSFFAGAALGLGLGGAGFLADDFFAEEALAFFIFGVWFCKILVG